MISLSNNCDRDRDRKLERHRNCNVRPSPGFGCFVSAFGIGGEHWGVRKSISFTHRFISHSDSDVILRDAPALLYIALNCSKVHNLLSVAFLFLTQNTCHTAAMTTLEMNGGPASIDSALIEKLRHSLKNSTVLTPESEGYREAIRRWSDAMEMKAVSLHESITHCLICSWII